MSEDYFRDVRKEISGFGSLDGEAVNRIRSADVEPSDDGTGITITYTCENCSGENHVVANWDELIVIANSLRPHDWIFDPKGYFKPHIGCPRCGVQVEVGLTPDECQRRVKNAIQARMISEGYVAQRGAALRQQQQALAQNQGLARR